MTIAISYPLLVGALLSLALFCAVTFLAFRKGMFDGGGGYASGLEGVFLIALYAFLWAIPTLAGWAIYAPWFGG